MAKTTKTIKTDLHRRVMPIESVQLRAEEGEEESRTLELSFSSETDQVKRFFGVEILDHDPGSIRLDFINGGRAPLLLDHDGGRQIGVIEGGSVKIGRDRKARALVRFSRRAEAEAELQDIRDGIRGNVSVGYRVHRLVREEGGDDAEDIFRVTDWEPLEISLVSVPADTSVGIGRSDKSREFETIVEDPLDEETATSEHERKATMPEANKPSASADPESRDTKPAEPAKPQIDERKLREDAAKAERERVNEILRLGARHNCRDFAEKEAFEGRSVEEFRGLLLDKLHKEGGEAKPLDDTPGDLGLENGDVRNYSLLKAIRAAMQKDWRQAALEQECSAVIAERLGIEPRGFLVPVDILRDPEFVKGRGKRALDTATATAGTELVGTDHLAGSFIELLRNRAMVMSLGARMLDGLVGNVSIPRQDSQAATEWVGEGAGTGSPGDPTFGTVTLSPKTIRARVDMTRRLLLQSSPSVEMLVRSDLASAVALGIDAAAINGGGGNAPTGILGTTGIGDVPLGTNGAAPTWAQVVGLETEVAIDNADLGALAYLSNAQVRGTLKTTEKTANTAQFIWPEGNEVNGYRAAASQQVPSNLTKGTGTNLSAMIFGNWADLLVGGWGILDVKPDETTLGDSGGFILRAFQDADVIPRHPQSFAATQDIVTS